MYLLVTYALGWDLRRESVGNKVLIFTSSHEDMMTQGAHIIVLSFYDENA